MMTVGVFVFITGIGHKHF